MSNIFIPKKIRVGFQERSDTFTGKLAYVIYYDEAGKIRKEKSWQGWCSKDIPALELDNKPVSGFVLNKGVKRYGSYFGSGRSMVRIYHPEGFEFEITVTNLMGVLAHSDVSRRDIVEKCTLAWEGGELVLIPVNSEEYQEAVSFTNKQDMKVSARDLVAGRSYHRRNGDETLTYVGYYEWFEMNREYNEGRIERTGGWSNRCESLSDNYQVAKGKKHVFWNGSSFEIPSVSTLAYAVSDDVSPELPEIVDKFFHTIHSQLIVDLEFVPLSSNITSEDGSMTLNNGAIFFKLSEDKTKLTKVTPNYSFFYYGSRHTQQIFNGTPYTVSKKDSGSINFRYSNWDSDNIAVPYTDTDSVELGLCKIDFIKADGGRYDDVIASKRAVDLFEDLGIGMANFILKGGQKSPIVHL